MAAPAVAAPELPLDSAAAALHADAMTGPGALDVRPWRPGDGPALSRAISESLEHLRPWMVWIEDEPLDDAARERWIAGTVAAREAGGDALFGIWEGDEVVGGCGLHRRTGPGGLEIGYWIHAGRLRRGYATEAVRRLCAIAFADPAVDRVEIRHDVANEASGRVPAAVGFTVVAERPSARPEPAGTGIDRIWRLGRAAWADVNGGR